MFVLPVPPPAQEEDRYRATAAGWENAAPDRDAPTLGAGGGPVTRYRTGPGDQPTSEDEWMGISIWDDGHNNAQNGRGLFVEIPGPPPEGHQGYDLPDQDLIPNRATTHQALFWSSWDGTVGTGQAFRGEHVTIARIAPGSQQGYMPTDPGMVQSNTSRNLPPPWDANLTIPRAATSM